MSSKKIQKLRQRFEARQISITLPGEAKPQKVSAGQALEHARNLAQSGNHQLAATIAISVARQIPKFVYPLNLAADCYLQLDELDAAKDALDTAMRLDKTGAATLRAQASLYRRLDRYEDAINIITRAVKIHPRNAMLHENFGSIHAEIGNYELAERGYSAALKCAPHSTTSMRLKTNLPGVPLTSSELEIARQMLISQKLSPYDERNLHFAIAQSSQHSGRCDQQILHLHAANKAHRATIQFDIAQEAAALECVRSTFTSKLYDSKPNARKNGDNLVFIVGMPRSGSSLIEQILSNHPQVCAAGESNALSLSLGELAPGKGWMAALHQLSRGDTQAKLQSLRESYLSRTEVYRTEKVMTDKTLGNYYLLGLIPLIFPTAKIVHTYRHPIDNCFGCYRRLFSGTSWAYTYDLEELALAYNNYQGIMRHWWHLFPAGIFNLEYEALVASQEDVTRSLLSYCGLDWHDSCMDFASNTRGVRTNSMSQVRAGLTAEHIGYWQSFGEELAPLLS